MERIVEVNGKKLAIGLEWSKLAGSNPTDAAKKLSQSRNCPMGVLWSVAVSDSEVDANAAVIHSAGLSHKKFKGVVYSAAAALAKSQDSIIGIERIEDDIFWMVVTQDGRVLPGYDFIASESEVKRKLQDLAIDTQLDYMQFYMSHDISAIFGLDGSIDESPFSLIGESNIDDSMRLKKMSGIPKAVFMGIAVAAAGAGLFGFKKYDEMKKAEELRLMIEEEEWLKRNLEEERLRAESSKAPNDPDILRQARAEEIRWMRDDFNSVNLLPAMKYMLLTMEGIPMQHDGWSVDGFIYSRSAPGMVNIMWDRQGGSPRSLTELMGSQASIGFTPEFDKANTSIAVDLGSRGFRDIMEIVKRKGMHNQELVSQLVEYGYDFSTAVNENNERKETIKGLTNIALQDYPQLEVASRNFEITGDDLPSYVMLISIMESADNFLLERIVFSGYANTFNWVIEGNLYE